MMFCSYCDKNGTNQMCQLVGNVRKSFYKGFIYPFEMKDKDISICPYCKNN